MAALMIQGCGSDVGKSVLVAGLCRLFANRGLTVRPFKPQNMSTNAAITAPDAQGRIGEIGRAQALQALACRTPPTVDMNPVLLKPQSNTVAQLIVRGQMEASFNALDYQARKAALLDIVLESFATLSAQADLVIVEGAGSPAETNLRAGDIANMGFARAARVPVVLVGDIDRGHVIASLVGAQAVLGAADNAMIHGFIINKFRGDATLFDAGRREIVRRTSWADIGLVPWLADVALLPAEDVVAMDRPRHGGATKIVIPRLPHIANFDDFDPLFADSALDCRFVPPGEALPGDADLVILPGSKATLADLAFLKSEGWAIDIAAHVRRGGRVLGICGGFQMLGTSVADLEGIEGPAGTATGLGLLDVTTVLGGDKVLAPAAGHVVGTEAAYGGFEMHIGRTSGPALDRPMLIRSDGRGEGAVSENGRVSGCYIHRLFDMGSARAVLLGVSDATDHATVVDAALDRIAAALAKCLDIPALVEIAGLKGPSHAVA